MELIYVGIDVSKEKLDVAYLQEKTCQHKIFTHDTSGIAALIKWLLDRNISLDNLRIAMEATGHYHLVLACTLAKQGIKLSVENPSKINAFAKACLRRGKDDKRDAKLIANYAKACQPALWQKPADEILHLQSLLAEYDSLKDQRVVQINRLKSLTELSHPHVKVSIEKHLMYLEQAIKEIEGLMADYVDQFPATLQAPIGLAQSVPGIGFLSAARLVVATEAGKRFKRARQLAAYLGLTPMVKHSGKNNYAPARLSKIGQSKLRAKLYFPAIQAILHNPDVKAFYQRLIQTGKRKSIAIAAAMRKLVHIVLGVLKQKAPYQPQKAMLAIN
jgi:transposase